MADDLYLEDFTPGRRFGSGQVGITADEIRAFATQYDPQPFHLDEEAARGSFFGGLAASGWHTAALTMRLLVDGPLQPAGGRIGAGLDEMRWPRPVRPGDTLHVITEVLEARRSRSRPDRGIIRLRTTTLNQREEEVQVMVSNMIVPARDAGDAE